MKLVTYDLTSDYQSKYRLDTKHGYLKANTPQIVKI